VVVDFSETWLNWVDGITTTDSILDVIIGADEVSTKDDVSLVEEDVRITFDDRFRADDDNDVIIDNVMVLDVLTPGDDSAKIKEKEKENGNKKSLSSCNMLARRFIISSVA